MHLIEAYFPARRFWQCDWLQRRCNIGILIEYLCKTLCGSSGLREFTAHFRKCTKGAGRKNSIENELTQCTRRHSAGQHITRTEPKDGDNTGKNQENSKPGQDCACLDRGASGLIGLFDGARKAAHHHIFIGEGLQSAHGTNLFARIGIGMGKHILRHA